MNDKSPAPDKPEIDEDFFEWEERDESISYLNHCIAGSFAGVAEHILLLPFDSIKTHMQVHDGKYSALQTAKHLYKTGGVTIFWRGASVLASGCVPAHAAYFSVYEFFKRKLLPKFHDQKNEIYPYAYALTGVLATVMHDLIIVPVDTLKQRKQIAPQHLNHTRALFNYVIKTEGPFSLYRGFPITLIMNVPQAAITVSANETLKILFRPKEGHYMFTYLACAAAAGAAAAMVTIPLDNIKTRLQTQTFYEDSRSEIKNSAKLAATTPFASNVEQHNITNNSFEPHKKITKYRDIISTAKTIFREEGAKGFVKGVIPRICSHAPSSAISWTAYEMLKKFLNKHRSY